jgi:putative ABC transport system substrate-binding protein
MPVIGLLGLLSPEEPEVAANLAAFRQGLGEAGFVEGRNVVIEYRWARNDEEKLPALAAKLVRRNVDVIVNEGGTPTALVAKNATATIPIVFHGTDAIGDGLVTSLARPGGNLTGVSLFGPEVLAKQFQLCLELLPNATAIGLLMIPSTRLRDYLLREIEQATSAKGMSLQVIGSTEDEIDAAYERLGRERAGVIVQAVSSMAHKLAVLAARHGVPVIYNQRPFAAAGGLLSYGPSIPAAYVIKGIYTGKILAGAKPADLPVQQATKLDLAINMKTAKALGLAVPPLLLARADEVIE